MARIAGHCVPNLRHPPPHCTRLSFTRQNWTVQIQILRFKDDARIVSRVELVPVKTTNVRIGRPLLRIDRPGPRSEPTTVSLWVPLSNPRPNSEPTPYLRLSYVLQ
ncbi:hypothetical protein SLA2020_441080 [Shorea laevis]